MTLQELFAKDDSWTQGTFVMYNCEKNIEQRCLLGGLYKVYGYGIVSNSIRSRIENEIGPVSLWNDVKERTIDDVRNLVKKLNI